mgnify:CR=1 FL=1
MAPNVEDIPAQNKFVLGIGSVWMLFPLVYGFFSLRSVAQCVLLINLFVSFCASLMLWSNPATNSFWHILDQLAAVLFFFCVAINSKITWFWPWFFFTVFLYACSYCAFQNAYFRLQLVSHLCFRFSAYWAAHWVFVPVKYHVHETYFAYFLLTTTHVMHMILLLWIARSRIHRSYICHTNASRDLYWRVFMFSVAGIVWVIAMYEIFVVCIVSKSVLSLSYDIGFQNLDGGITNKTPLLSY